MSGLGYLDAWGTKWANDAGFMELGRGGFLRIRSGPTYVNLKELSTYEINRAAKYCLEPLFNFGNIPSINTLLQSMEVEKGPP